MNNEYPISNYEFHRYSMALKQKVVTGIESGKLGISEAKTIYDIRSLGTISKSYVLK